jgi:L,D-peptidoglycan transpeptidase YkuD (ErfK/YbiS/YcfS/YnhG family)
MDIEQRIAQSMNIHAQTNNRRAGLVPVIVTVIVAVVGTAGIVNNLRPGNDSQDRGSARMITSAAVSRVGAIEIPSEPPAGRRQRGVSS